MSFECVQMKTGVTYNISAGTWHNIAMDKDAELIIVEKSDTYKQDCAYISLDLEQQQKLYKEITSRL